MYPPWPSSLSLFRSQRTETIQQQVDGALSRSKAIRNHIMNDVPDKAMAANKIATHIASLQHSTRERKHSSKTLQA
jgi:uncharacterized protein YoxC